MLAGAMIRFLSAALAMLAAFTLTVTTAHAVEDTWDYSVQVSSSVQTSPARITLTWPQDTNGIPSSYTIYRKAPADTSWGNGATLPGSTTTYTDTNVTTGTAYEYRIVKTASTYNGYGYIETGIAVPLVENRGKIVLLVDNTVAGPLATELAQLQQDLAGDGWIVLRHDVSRTDSVVNIKAVIKADYAADPANVKSVFLFGHIPVPYSGQFNPDGHPDHVGAWPADVYYGDVDGNWTDSTVNYIQTLNTDPVDAARMSNVPFDGKFDQTEIPSAVELQVGRVDLANLPGRTTWGGPATLPAEVELLRKYLNKDHAFRTRVTNPPRRAILGDYFGSRGGEAFAASGFRSFAPLVGANNIRNLNTEFNDQKGVWIPQAAQNDYLLAYGCGAGSYTGISGIGNTGIYNVGEMTEMVANNVHGVFNLLFGSWNGDWDHEDNILRSPLATDYGLVSVWSGRPHWFIHPMGLGETIGSTTQLNQNNVNTYETQINSAAHRVHIALMGDPTLRLHPVVPVSGLTGSVSGSAVSLNWTAATDSNVVGYHVYRAASVSGPFTRVTTSPVTATSFIDNAGSTSAVYMVRTIKLENTTSGSYYNPSQGAFWSASAAIAITTTTTPAPSTSNTTTTSTAPSTTTSTPTATTSSGTTTTQSVTSTTSTSTSSADTTTATGTVSAATANTDTANAAKFMTNVGNTSSSFTWVDDALPAGATGNGSNGDAWNWVSASPAPYSGTKAHQSNTLPGLHEHTFSWATTPLVINTGEILFTYVYLDPANMPGEIMLSWGANNWEHRAYWGANKIPYGTDGTANQYYVGPMPAAGQWVRLEVPAKAVGLEGASIIGMSYALYDGGATFDASGKALPSAPALRMMPIVSVVATDAAANISDATDTAVLTFSRTGSTSKDLVVNFNLGGSAVKWTDYYRAPQGDMPTSITIPAGAASATMTIVGRANTTTANPETATFTLATDSSYTVGPQSSATVTFATTSVAATTPTTTTTTPTTSTTTSSTPTTTTTTSSTPTTTTTSPTPTTTTTSPTPTTTTTSSTPTTTTTSSTPTTTTTTTTSSTPTTTTTSTSTASASGDTVWFDDALPAGAGAVSTGGDSWNWVNSNPAPFSGASAHQSNIAAGIHEHSFGWASSPLTIASGEKLVAYIYLDPANTPSEVMISWFSDNWEHRAFWGNDSIAYGAKGTASRYYMGPLPASGQWVRLEVPASAVALEGASITGMSFGLYDGRATWDAIGKAGAASTSTTSGSTSTSSGSTTTTSGSTTTTTAIDETWVDDALPAGAGGVSTGGDSWNWVSSNPAPFTGASAHQSSVAPGVHEHFFGWASTPLTIASGDKLFTYVYLDPANMPTEVMLSWYSDNWEHRAYWGADFMAYGTNGTTSRYYVGALPAAGQWVRLEVPASAVGLEGASLTGMGFGLYNGRATWDKAGKVTTTPSTSTSTSSGGTTTSSGGTTSTSGGTTSTSGGTTSTSGSGSTSTSGSTTTTTSGGTNTGTSVANAIGENALSREPQVGDYQLRILSPTVLELERVTTKQADPATITDWNFVDSSGNFSAPATSEFAVTVNGQPATVTSIGFRRRAVYGELLVRDLRIDNYLYLTLASPITDGQAVEVKNPSTNLWPTAMKFAATTDPLRFNPAIHVNQEGYVPSLPKKAMIGYNLGNQGELNIDSSIGFKLVSAATGISVYTGTLTVRRETGYELTPLPYQKVLQADFTAFQTPGEYQLVVPGFGASLPFVIDDGIAMNFLRTYELGLYHQRCGTDNAMPFTRFVHDACHTAPAEIPTNDPAYTFTWNCIASKSGGSSTQTAPQLTSPATQLYPFVNQGLVDVRGGHHDAGDYSKYTIDVAWLVHQLMFTADSIQGAAAFDNLGIPQSGDGISDIMQEAKQESDYLAKLQDADGGFYFIVYPKNREYEGDVLPDHGDSQVVWPKNTSATAAAVAALAQCASSPLFKKAYPTEAAAYLAKAKLGWQFLTKAIAAHGKAGAYQKVTFYGDEWTHDDELAWAACEMYLATGDTQYQQKLFEWFPNPADSNTFRWTWWRMCQSWGCAIRSYAFAARSGRLATSQLDATYLAACEGQVKAAGEDALKWSAQSAYGFSFPDNTKHGMQTGWFFSLDQASDMAVAYQLNPKPEYIDALVSNMNYEGGSNPVNVSFLAGVGVKRPQQMVSQYGRNDRRLLPPTGEPQANVQASFSFLPIYGQELGNLSFPSDGTAGAVYPLQDRWTDVWNVTTEFVTLNQARALTSVAMLAAQTPAKSTPWKPTATATIVVPAVTAAVGTPTTLSLGAAGLDLTNARIVWEARDQQPDYGSTFTVTPKTSGAQWVEVEISWPDGRRVFGTTTFNAQ
jgi:hypothetical protein